MGFTPFYMLFGRETLISADLVYGDPLVADPPRDDSLPQTNPDENGLRSSQERSGRAAQRRKATYDLRVRPHSFEVGSCVWCLVSRRHSNRYPKWQSLYKGPF